VWLFCIRCENADWGKRGTFEALGGTDGTFGGGLVPIRK
jgi:hypothetical protein